MPTWPHLAGFSETGLVADSSDPVIEAADRFLTGGIRLLGRDMAPWSLGWQTDPRTGFEWPTTGGKGAVPPPGSDIKAPWELSRFYFAPWLANAAGISGDDRYLAALTELLEDWIASNPVGRGVNWSTGMEAAIRAANWSAAIGAVAAHRGDRPGHAGEEFAAVALPSLVEHGHWIRHNLERGPGPPANHLLVGLSGLAIVGWLFAESRQGQRWLDLAERRLEREARRQFGPSGAHVEQSPYYHRLCVEALTSGAAALRAAGRDSRDIEAVARRALRFVSAYTCPNGTAPPLGDSDDGRFVIATGMIDHERDHHAHLAWGLGEARLPPVSAVEIFADSGYVFLRSTPLETTAAEGIGDNSRLPKGEVWASLRCGPFGRYCGHVHSDQLHLTLCYNQAKVILDPGTGCYTADPALRNRLRCGASHNAPILDGRDPEREITGDVFWLADATRSELLEARANRQGSEARGRHFGYSDVDVSVTRHLRLNRAVEIVDQVTGAGKHLLEWSFALSGEWELQGDALKGSCEGEAVEISWQGGGMTSARLESGPYSPAYGITDETSWLHLTREDELPLENRIRITFTDEQ